MHALMLNVVLASASLVGVLGLIDWFLTEEQKRELTDLSIKVWSFLDEVKKRRLLLLFALERPQRLIILIAAILTTLILVYQPESLPHTDAAERFSVGWWLAEIIVVVAMVIQVKFVLPRMIEYVFHVEAEEGGNVGIFRLLILFVTVGGFLCVPLVMMMDSDYSILRGAGLLGWLIVVASFEIALIVTYLIVLARIGLFVARPILATSELIMRRIAESPKGPLAAITGLVGGVAGLLKLYVA